MHHPFWTRTVPLIGCVAGATSVEVGAVQLLYRGMTGGQMTLCGMIVDVIPATVC